MRIYKGSEITLKLYTRINCQSIEADKMRVVLFTKNPNNSCIVNNIVVSGNTLLVTIGRNDLNAMEDGVINYIILGYDDNEEIYNSTRQSNYYLKTPDGYVAKSIQTSKDVYIVDNGDYKILPDEDYSSIEEVNVHVEFDAEPYIQRGIELGEENQKSKLESVSITENGIYTREDGYNEIHVEVPDLNGDFQTGYDEGYTEGYVEGEANGIENAGSIIAETARVLEVTENGYYMSRYSEPPIPDVVTGAFSSEENFYNYNELNSIVFDTQIPATPTTRLELWYKGDNTMAGDAYNLIIGAGKYDDANAYQIRYDSSRNDRIRVELGFNILYHTWDENAWHHILIDKETEDASCMSLWIDEVKVGDFTNYSFYPDSTFYINGIEYDLGGQRKANGCFGMIKIDDTIIIPVVDGFLNHTDTSGLLGVVEEGGYIFTDTTPEVPEGNLIKTVKVNVQPKIDIEKEGIKFAYSSFTTLPEWADFSNITSMRYMFYSCSSLQTIPLIDISNVTDMFNAFRYCSSLQTIPLIDTSKVISMERAFSDCGSLQTIPSIDTSNVENANRLFNGCGSLQSLPALNAEKMNLSSYGIFGGTLNALTDFGGLIGLKSNCNNNYGFNCCPNLTYQSCINILNGLADVTELGSRTLKVHQNFIDLVGDEISIGTSKNWVITT